MLSFEPEIAAARDSGSINAETAARLIARERREIVPVSRELRALAWLGVMLIATGAGIIIKKHYDEIGPLAIAAAMGAASIGCYLFALWRPKTAHNISDYVVLLGALLFSAEVAFVEAQWHLLGGQWQRHFLFIAVVHAIVAYAFDSRAVLSLSLTAFAAWMGIERTHTAFDYSSGEFAMRAFVCAGIFVLWRIVNRKEDFRPVFEHFAANIAFWGAVALTTGSNTRYPGLLVALVFAVGSTVYGIRRRYEAFIIYGVVYGLIALNVALIGAVNEEIFSAFFIVVSTVAAIVTLTVVHFRLRKKPA